MELVQTHQHDRTTRGPHSSLENHARSPSLRLLRVLALLGVLGCGGWLGVVAATFLHFGIIDVKSAPQDTRLAAMGQLSKNCTAVEPGPWLQPPDRCGAPLGFSVVACASAARAACAPQPPAFDLMRGVHTSVMEIAMHEVKQVLDRIEVPVFQEMAIFNATVPAQSLIMGVSLLEPNLVEGLLPLGDTGTRAALLDLHLKLLLTPDLQRVVVRAPVPAEMLLHATFAANLSLPFIGTRSLLLGLRIRCVVGVEVTVGDFVINAGHLVTPGLVAARVNLTMPANALNIVSVESSVCTLMQFVCDGLGDLLEGQLQDQVQRSMAESGVHAALERTIEEHVSAASVVLLDDVWEVKALCFLVSCRGQPVWQTLHYANGIMVFTLVSIIVCGLALVVSAVWCYTHKCRRRACLTNLDQTRGERDPTVPRDCTEQGVVSMPSTACS